MSPNPEALYKEFPASAEYLSQIYLIKRDYGKVTNTKLAEWMDVSASAVTQALGRLKKLALAVQDRYRTIELTELGRELAITTLKRHYLLEHLLVKTLDFPWDKADEEAKVLQSQISQDLADHLMEKLGRPQTCPHGNPIPGTEIESRLLQAPRLTEAQVGGTILLLRITEEGEGIPGMLPFCQKHGLRPGKKFLVVSRNEGSVVLQTSPESAPFAVPISLALHIRFEKS